MSLLHEIQEAIVQEESDLGSVLLKLRLLASRLGSETLEEWVKHESEGYPEDASLPSYRVVALSYEGSFAGSFGSSLSNVKIPLHIVKQEAGESWAEKEIRESISGLEEILRMSAKSGKIGIDTSNLILLLQGKIYPEYTCIDITATIPRTAVAEIKQTVRSRILELTLQLEKEVPAATHISFGALQQADTQPERVQQISQQIFYGDVATAVSGSTDFQLAVEIGVRDQKAFAEYLAQEGIPIDDAKELAEIVQAEEPTSSDEPFGEKARSWLGVNLKKAAEGTWGVGVSVATRVITEAALKFYGLK